MYTVSNTCSPNKDAGEIADACASGTKEWGTISEYSYSASDERGSYTCSI
jgi:hypothetical protein